MATIVAAAGGGAWQTDATWVGGSKPTAADDVQLDATSGNVTIDSGAVCRSLDCLGYTGTLTHSVTLTIGDGTAGAGNRALRLASGMTYSSSGGTFSFVSTSATVQTVTRAGLTVTNANLYFNGTGGSWQLADSWTASGTTISLVRGTLDTNSQAVSVAAFDSSYSNTRTLTLGSSAITLSSTGTAWSAATVTNLTVTANTATVTLTGANATFTSGAKDWNGMSLVQSGSGSVAVSGGAFTVANYTRTGTASKTDWLVMNSGGFTCTGTCTLTGNSATNRLLVFSSTLGTARTITAATVSATHCDFRDITGAGAGSWDFSAAEIGNALGNSGMTFRANIPKYAVATGNVSGSIWSLTSGGASGASVPLCHDTIICNAASGAITVTNDMPRMCADLTCTGFTGTLAFGSAVNTQIHGSITLGSGMTITGTLEVGFYGSSSHTVTSAGKTWPTYLRFYRGSYTLTDALVSSRSSSAAVYPQGLSTLNDGGFSITCYSFYLAVSTATATLSGTTTILASALTDPWFVSAATLNHTGSIVLSGATATDRTFAGSGKTYGTLTDQNTSTGKLTITGQNTFGTINKTAAAACTLALPTSSGITVTGQFNVQGTSTATLTLTGDVTKASGLVECDFMSISNSDATGGARFYAPNSTDGGSNTGWIFTAAPTPTTGGMLSIVYQLNRLAGTSGLEMAGAANAWAGTSGLEVVGALNARLRQVDSSHTGGLEMNGVCRQLAIKLGGEGTYDAPRALASIPT